MSFAEVVVEKATPINIGYLCYTLPCVPDDLHAYRPVEACAPSLLRHKSSQFPRPFHVLLASSQPHEPHCTLPSFSLSLLSLSQPPPVQHGGQLLLAALLRPQGGIRGSHLRLVALIRCV